MALIVFVTGNDTGVGKTVFAATATRGLFEAGIRVAALKPVCSGGRTDARILRAAAGNVLPLDEVNPWHFRAPLAPLLAARMERKKLRLTQVVKHVRTVARCFDIVLVEGAGGLLSPLGEDFDSRDLITRLNARPVLVVPNELGAVNQVRLLVNALPRALASRTDVVLANPPRATLASRTNPDLLKQFVPAKRLDVMPWLRLTGSC
jgi:dethiobiotin synthetase